MNMDILKFEIIEDGDNVENIEDNKIHIRKKNGDYAVYTLKLNESNECIDFSVFMIVKGSGSFELMKDADLHDLADAWSK